MAAVPPTDLNKAAEESDSSDDSDFVPTFDADSDSDASGDERPSKRRKVVGGVEADNEQKDEEDPEEAKKARKALWDDFQSSAVTLPASRPETAQKVKLVKIEKRYRFAGEDVIEVVEVPEDSEDAKTWPRVESVDKSAAEAGQAATPPAPPAAPTPSSSTSTPASTTPQPSDPPTATSTSKLASSSVPKKRPPPGPRKAKTQFLSAAAKPKKLSTFAKSAMDWSAHVASDKAMKEDLEANRRGGGYLEKVDFLGRVEDRKEAEREKLESSRRRKK